MKCFNKLLSFIHRSSFLIIAGLLLMLHWPTHINAQDTIYFLHAQKLVVKIMAIEPKVVKYKHLENPQGPYYVVSKRNIQRIVYSNGRVENLETPPKSPEEKLWPVNWLKGQTHVNYILSDLIWGFVGFEVEHNLCRSRLGVKIPVSLGSALISESNSIKTNNNTDQIFINSEFGYYNKNKLFSTGLEIYVYTSGRDIVNYFFGPAFGYGAFKYADYDYYTYPIDPGIYSQSTATYISLFFKNGVRIQPMKHMNISISLGTGNYVTEYDDNYLSPFPDDLYMEGSVSVGYTF